MGYLDNSTVTVDAILTKQGRRVLAEGGAVSVTDFCLSDTGVNYDLWNPDHPSGSAYYGEAIENLPQVEALPNAGYFMRNKLVTLRKDTTAMPIIANIPESFAYGKLTTPETFTPKMINHVESGYFLVVPDIIKLSVTGGSEVVDFSPNVQQFLMQQETEDAAVFSFTNQISINPKAIFDTDGNSLTVIIAGKETGAWASCKLTWDSNILKAPVTNLPKDKAS
jgi:hypothetical protein|tara:strand:+ start:915 stop:1583 length:669 start_codon:yes stop_codon:yes gene_type:complete